MHDQAQFKQRIEDVLRTFLDTELGLLTALGDELSVFARQARTAVGSGKRLRAAFCYWGWRAAGQPDCEGVVRAAAAMEVVHAAAIVHDDIIDGSPLRHGAPSAQLAFSAVDPAPGRSVSRAGIPAGTGLALLLGNLLIAWSAQLFAESGLPGPFLARARPLWASLARDLVAGEALEILRTATPVPAERALQIVRLKTAKYTVEQPLHLGGLLAGAPARTLEVFSAYGLPLGEAFQLRDDLLGVFGDPAATGKSNVDDLVGGKPTVLLALTRQAADPAQRARLDALVGRRDLSGEQAEQIRALMTETKAPQRVEQLVRERVDQALYALDRAGLDREGGGALRALAASVYQRTN